MPDKQVKAAKPQKKNTKKKSPKPTSGKEPLAKNASKAWANDVLLGKFNTNPYLKKLMEEEEGSVMDNPELANISDNLRRELKEDWLGEQRALAEQAEGAGRYGGGLYQSLRTRATEETEEAASDAISRMYAGAYENKQNRRAGVVGQTLGAQESAARVPIEWGQLSVARGHLNVAKGQLKVDQGRLGLARNEFAFNKKMSLLGAQQDAVNDYMQLLMGLGSMGGTSTGSGQFIPSQNPFGAAIMGGLGGYMAAGGDFGQGGGGEGQIGGYTGGAGYAGGGGGMIR